MTDFKVQDDLLIGAKVHVRSFAYSYVNGTPRKTAWASIAQQDQTEHYDFVSTRYLRPV